LVCDNSREILAVGAEVLLENAFLSENEAASRNNEKLALYALSKTITTLPFEWPDLSVFVNAAKNKPALLDPLKKLLDSSLVIF
jgi:hypothetical protein